MFSHFVATEDTYKFIKDTVKHATHEHKTVRIFGCLSGYTKPFSQSKGDRQIHTDSGHTHTHMHARAPQWAVRGGHASIG